MKSMKLFCAAALLFGMGFGFSGGTRAASGDCEIDWACMDDCKAAGCGVLFCRAYCCN